HRLAVELFAHHRLALVDDPGHPIAVLAARLLVEAGKHLFEPVDVSPGLAEVVFKRPLQLRIRRGLGQRRQGFRELLLGIVGVTQFFEEGIVKRLRGHRAFSSFVNRAQEQAWLAVPVSKEHLAYQIRRPTFAYVARATAYARAASCRRWAKCGKTIAKCGVGDSSSSAGDPAEARHEGCSDWTAADVRRPPSWSADHQVLPDKERSWHHVR